MLILAFALCGRTSQNSSGSRRQERQYYTVRLSLKSAVVILVIPALFVLSIGCEDRGVEPPQQAEEPVSFSDDIQPILSARCLACHSPGGVASFLQLTDDQSYSNLVNQPALFSEGKRVEPGDPGGSALYNRIADTGVSGGRMPPPPSSLLSPEEVDLVRRWIAEGAEDN